MVYKTEQLSRQTPPRFSQQRTAILQRYVAAAAKASGPGVKESAELQAATGAMTEKLALIESTKGEREMLEDSWGVSVEWCNNQCN